MSFLLVLASAFFRMLVFASAKAANRANHVLDLFTFGLKRSVKFLVYAIGLAIRILGGLPGIFKRLEGVLTGVAGVDGVRLAADHSGIGMPGCLPGHLVQLFKGEVFIRDPLLDLLFRLFASLGD
jgi:hypothetical protein